MQIKNLNAVVTGGASGLGLATARRLVEAGATVTLLDLPTSPGEQVSEDLGPQARFAPCDITDEVALGAALDAALEQGPLRAVVHCAGRGRPMRVLDKQGRAAPMEHFESVVRLNVLGSFNVLRLAAERMAVNEPLQDDRGVIVLTSSVAAYDGQVGQVNYAASKAGIVGLTLPAARDLADVAIRVCTIAPGIFDTPLLAGLPENVRASLAKSIPHPPRLGSPDEFGDLAVHVIENGMLNGETIRLDGAIRMAPR